MTLSIVLGVGIVVSLMLFLAFNLGKEHSFLKNMLIIFSFSMLFIIPASIFSTCEVVLDNTTEQYIYGNNFSDSSPHWDPLHYSEAPTFNPSDDAVYLFGIKSTYNYGEYCYDVIGSGAFIKAVKWVYVVFVAYLIVFLFVKSSFFLVDRGRRK